MKYDIVIIGGGIVGTATALRLKELNPRLHIVLIEKEYGLAKHQTGNNSGVIHSGIYYRPGSLKATNCIQGYKELIEFCDREGIKYDLCGKLIVATHEKELPRLHNLYERGLENGLKDIKMVQGHDIREYEPHVSGIEAIHVPYTGIIDYTQVTKKYAEIFSHKYEGEIYFNDCVRDIRLYTDHTETITDSRTYKSKLVINTAGLFSDRLARINKKRLQIRIIPFRGEYYKLKPQSQHLVKNLIYPVPDPAFPFLGVHFTRMIKGGIEAGPNAVWAFKREGYKKSDISIGDIYDSLSWPGFRKVMMKYWSVGFGEFYRSYYKQGFVNALQKLVPAVSANDIIPGGSGVRAQACSKDGKLIDDFLFVEGKQLINVLNAPSPAATASLSIGKTIAEKALKRF